MSGESTDGVAHKPEVADAASFAQQQRDLLRLEHDAEAAETAEVELPQTYSVAWVMVSATGPSPYVLL